MLEIGFLKIPGLAWTRYLQSQLMQKRFVENLIGSVSLATRYPKALLRISRIVAFEPGNTHKTYLGPLTTLEKH